MKKKRRINDPVIQRELRSEESKAKKYVDVMDKYHKVGKALGVGFDSVGIDANPLASPFKQTPNTFPTQVIGKKRFKTGDPDGKVNPFNEEDMADIIRGTERLYATIEFVGSISSQGKNRIIYIPTYILKNIKLPKPKTKMRIRVTLEKI